MSATPLSLSHYSLGQFDFEGWRPTFQIGEGASAVVYRATKGNAEAALKIFKPEIVKSSSEEVQAARIERQLRMKALIHPNLVSVLSGGRHPETGLFYLLMEYLPFQTLDKLVNRLPPHRIAPILAQLAEAARFLEESGFSHRDIKPENIAIDDDFRRAILLDFGVLLPLAGSSVTDQGSNQRRFLGTTRYSPPEFLMRHEERSLEAYRAITFYQLGAVLHDMATGHPLFYEFETEPYTNLTNAVQDEYPSFKDVRKGVEQRCVELASRCLQKKPGARLEAISWDSFSCRRFARRPVVVLLYTGGTIGAFVPHDSPNERDLRRIESLSHPFLQQFKARVIHDHSLLSGPASPFPFDLEWVLLPPEQQLLSENAEYGTWESLARAIEGICADYRCPLPPGSETGSQLDAEGEPAKYLAGIVVLHGTDTLAYSAAALAVSLRNLPCPIVLTGSNQPPKVDDIREQDPTNSNRSDAWRNVRRCLLFIQTFGHRFTEVFVCFGDTVHVAINLRKTSANLHPYGREVEAVEIQEPYLYRNEGAQRQYMFRVIEEIYCNNFYPISGGLAYDVLLKDIQQNTYRHFRESPLGTRRVLSRATFSSGVRLAHISPAFFGVASLESRLGECDGLENAQVLVLEGYHSGTFPTHPQHRFTEFIKRLIARAIPIVLVTRSGLIPTTHPYEKHRVDGFEVPVLPLFGVVAETAVPLVSVIRAEIPEGEWSPAEPMDSRRLLELRISLLKAAIRRWQEDSKGILSALLGSLVDEAAQLKRLGEGVERDKHEFSSLVDRLFLGSENPNTARLAKESKEGRFDRTKTVLMREHFLWILVEILRPFELAGSGPDGLAVLNEMGFVWGGRIFESLKAPEPPSEGGIFEIRPPARREEMIKRAQMKVERLAKIIRKHGVADVTPTLAITSTLPDPNAPENRVSLEVTSLRHGSIVRPDELYTATTYSGDERSFFELLRDGADLMLYDDQCEKDIERRFRQLFKDGPGFRLSPLDWFLIGTFKATLCRILRDLRFDTWVEFCRKEDRNHVLALRQSVRVTVISSDEGGWRAEFTYERRDDVV